MSGVCVWLSRSVCCCLLLLFLSTAMALLTEEALVCNESEDGTFISNALHRSYTVETLPIHKVFTNLTDKLSYVDKWICNQDKSRVGFESFAELWYLASCILCKQTTDFGRDKNKTNILTSAYIDVGEHMKPEDIISSEMGIWMGWGTNVGDGVARSVALLDTTTGDPVDSTTVPLGKYTIVLTGSNTQSCYPDASIYLTWGLLSKEAEGEALSRAEHVICEKLYKPPPPPITNATSTPTSISTSTPPTTDPLLTTDPTDGLGTTQEPTDATASDITITTTEEPMETTTNDTTSTTTEESMEPTENDTTTITTEEPIETTTNDTTTISTEEPMETTTNNTTSTTTEDPTEPTTNPTNTTTTKGSTSTTTDKTTTTTTEGPYNTTEPESTNLPTGMTEPSLVSTTTDGTTPTTTSTSKTSTTTTLVPGIDCCIIEVDSPPLCPGDNHKEGCQEGYDGWVEIRCDKNGSLIRTDSCVARWINNVGDKVTSGNYSAIDLAIEVKNYTEGEAELTSNDLGELIGVIGNLTFLLDVQVEEVVEGEREGLATNYTSQFVALVGNIISNTKAWDATSKVKAAELGSSLLGDLEHTGFTLAGQVTRGTIPFNDPDLDLTVYSYPREEIKDDSLYFPSPSAPTHLLLPPLATFQPPPGGTETDPQARVVCYLVRRNITGLILPGSLNRDVPHPRSKEVNSGVVSLSMGEQGRRVTFGGRGRGSAEAGRGGSMNGGGLQGGGGSVQGGGRSVQEEGSLDTGEGGESVIIRLQHAFKEVGPAYRELHRDPRPDEEVPTRVPGSATCVYWDLDQSVWAPDGCETINSTREVTYCRCYHLTMFAIITDVHGYVGRDPVLDLLGTCLTCLSCIASFITFIILHTARSDVSPQRISITKQLCLAIGLSHLSILLLLDRDFLKQSETMCVGSSVLMHYLTTAGVCWMLAEGVHLLHTIHTVLSAAQLQPLYWLGGYGVPAVVVMVTLLIAYGNEGWITQEAYAPQGSEYCWLSTEQGYIWAFTAPLVFMIVVNTVIMILALRAAATLQVNRQKSRYQRAMVWVRGSFSLNCVLGVSWVFGLIYMNSAYFFAYLFTIFNASQGVMLLIFNCLLNESVWTAFIARLPARLAKCLTKKKKNSSSKTTTRATTRATTTHHHHHHHHHNHNRLPDNQSHHNNNHPLTGYDNPALSLDDHNYQTINHSDHDYHNQSYPASNHNYHYNNNNHGAIIALKRCFDEWIQYDSDSRQRGSDGVVDEGAAARPKNIEEADTNAASRWRVAGDKMGKWWRNEAPITTTSTSTTTPTPNNHSNPTHNHNYSITGVSRASPGESPQMPRRRERRAPSQWSTDTFISYISDSPMMSHRRQSLDSSVTRTTSSTSSTPLSTPPNTLSSHRLSPFSTLSPTSPPSSRFSLPASFSIPPQSSFPSSPHSSIPPPPPSQSFLPPSPPPPPPQSSLSSPPPVTRRYSLPPSISPPSVRFSLPLSPSLLPRRSLSTPSSTFPPSYSPVRKISSPLPLPSSLPLSPSPLPRRSLSTPSSPSPLSYSPVRKTSSPLPLPTSLKDMGIRGNSRAVKESLINPHRYPAEDQRYTPEFDTIIEYDDERSPKRVSNEKVYSF